MKRLDLSLINGTYCLTIKSYAPERELENRIIILTSPIYATIPDIIESLQDNYLNQKPYKLYVNSLIALISIRLYDIQDKLIGLFNLSRADNIVYSLKLFIIYGKYNGTNKGQNRLKD